MDLSASTSNDLQWLPMTIKLSIDLRWLFNPVLSFILRWSCFQQCFSWWPLSAPGTLTSSRGLLHCPSSLSSSSSLSFSTSSGAVLIIAVTTNSKHWQLQFSSCWPRIIVCFPTGECFTGLRTSTAVWRPSLLSCLYSPPSSFFPSSGQGAHHHKGLDMVEHPAEYTSVRNVFALPKSTEFYPPS